MTRDCLWTIDRSDLVDTYSRPNLLGDVVLTVPAAGERDRVVSSTGDRSWPLFHPSEADPEGGYRLHPYTVLFPLADEPGGAYLLRLDYLAIAPRLAALEIDVNGVSGCVYLRPSPSPSGEIRLQAGLHTSIYAEGCAEVVLPASLLRRGDNRITLTARDGGEIIHVENIERIRRLDRMANGAGFLYQRLSLLRLPAVPASVLARFEVKPSVIHCRDAAGALKERCHLYLEFSRPVAGGTLDLEIAAAGEQRYSLPAVAFGHLRLPFEAPDGEGPVSYTLAGTIDGEEICHGGEFARCRKWKVFVTPHAHTDIGYTHRQWEVAERLCRNVDSALDILADSPSLPFAYHLDSTWALETYVATRGANRQQMLLAQIRAGRIGIPHSYVDLLSQFAALEDLIRNGEWTDAFLRPAGLGSDFTTVVDVASLTGSLPALLAGSGVRYLVHADNQDRGPFRLLGRLHHASPYYWEGTNGGRVLVWLAKMYCELRKVCGSPPVPDAAARGLDMWLEEYERPDYRPDAVLLYGQEADNTDLDRQPAEFIRRWNETYAYPRLIPSAVGDFFRYVEERFASSFPTVRGDGGAYWEDGVGSHLRSAAMVRQAQAMLPAAEALESLAVMHTPDWAYPLDQYDDAWRQILLFDEHTWGAFLSGTDPGARLQQDIWTEKERMAREALQWTTRLLHVASGRHSLSWNTAGREVVVYNPHNWTVSGAVTVEIGREEVAADPVTGAALPMRLLQATPSQALVELRVDDLPGLSYRRFPLREAPRELPAAPVSASFGEEVILENDDYRLVIDPRHGGAVSWFDRTLDRELVDSSAGWGLGRFLYVRGGEGTRLMSNRLDLPDGDPEILADFTATGCECGQDELGRWARVAGIVPAGTLEIEWRLPHTGGPIDLRYVYLKEPRQEKEAVYVAFPLDLPGARVLSDSQLGWVDWDRDGLPGACKEWLPLQTAMLALHASADVLICSPDVPLFCVGSVVQGRWPAAMDLTGGHLYSYVLNNYWHTNYKASQGGEIVFRYRLAGGRAISPARAYQMGHEMRRPLYAHRISLQEFRSARPPYSAPEGGTLARIGGEGVALTALKKARWADGYIVRLQEISGRPGHATVAFPALRVVRAWTCDLLEHDHRELAIEPDATLRVDVPAWGLRSIRIVVETRGDE